MWKKLAPLLIALSVALNVGIGGAWIVHAIGQCRSSSPGHGHAEGVWSPLHRNLGVTADQWKLIEEDLERLHRASQEQRRIITTRQGELLDMIAAENPDRDAIAAKRKEINESQSRMQEMVIEWLLHEKEMLTPEQSSALFQAIRSKVRCAGPMPMMNGCEDSFGGS